MGIDAVGGRYPGQERGDDELYSKLTQVLSFFLASPSLFFSVSSESTKSMGRNSQGMWGREKEKRREGRRKRTATACSYNLDDRVSYLGSHFYFNLFIFLFSFPFFIFFYLCLLPSPYLT